MKRLSDITPILFCSPAVTNGDILVEIIFYQSPLLRRLQTPLYAFLAVPTVKIFGLTEFAVRLPNAIFSVLAIGAIYLLANKLFPDQELKIKNLKLKIGNIAAAILSVSPWHIQLSRGAFEANLATFLLPMGIYFFLESHPFLSALFLPQPLTPTILPD